MSAKELRWWRKSSRPWCRGRLTGLAATVVRVRGAVSLEREKRRTITDAGECLTGSGQAGRGTHRDASGGEWTITLGSAVRRELSRVRAKPNNRQKAVHSCALPGGRTGWFLSTLLHLGHPNRQLRRAVHLFPGWAAVVSAAPG